MCHFRANTPNKKLASSEIHKSPNLWWNEVTEPDLTVYVLRGNQLLVHKSK